MGTAILKISAILAVQAKGAMKAALTLPNDIAELPRLLEFAATFAASNKLAKEEVNRLLVIMDELFSNIVRHGYDTPDASGTIAVRLSFARGRLRIAFSDDGRPFDPLAATVADLDLPMSQRPTGGLGIHFVRNLANAARYSRLGGWNRLVLIRRTDPPHLPR